MRWLTAFHLIAMVAWFAGLFYLPRLFVYHAQTSDRLGLERFKVMERKLYRYIMMPAAILTTAFGLALLGLSWDWYKTQNWMLIKLAAVVLLWIYHFYCGHLVKLFAEDQNPHSSLFYRWFNEIPTLLLFIIIIMVVVKP